MTRGEAVIKASSILKAANAVGEICPVLFVDMAAALGMLKLDEPMRGINEADIEAVAEAIELVENHSSEEYAKAAIAALIERGWGHQTARSKQTVEGT